MSRGDYVIPSWAAVVKGFKPSRRALRQRGSSGGLTDCACCGRIIAPGDLYSALEIRSPLCAACLVPEDELAKFGKGRS